MYGPQKVLHLKDELKKKNPKLDGMFFIQEKFEGWFVSVYYNSTLREWGFPTSSNGRIIPALKWTKYQIFNSFPKLDYDVILEAEAWQDMPFEKLNGLLNRSKGNYDFKDVMFMFNNCYIPSQSNLPYSDRYIRLSTLINHMQHSQCLLVPNIDFTHYDLSAWEKLFEDIAKHGGEGIIAKRDTAIYSPGKRNADVLKLKLECEIDAIADRLETGIGEKGFPSLTLISKRKNGAEIRTVISRHEDQQLFTKTPSEIIGKVVKIKGMQEYEDGKIRQPVFCYVRTDKSINDIN